MQATVFSDASYCHRTRAAGWGAWCKTDDMQFGATFGGRFVTAMPTVTAAELCGIHNALRHAIQNSMVFDTFTVMVQCDSVEALGLIFTHVSGVGLSPHPHTKKKVQVRRLTRRMLPVEQEAVARIGRMVHGCELRLLLRHVKGHKSGDGRNWVNRECDRIAKRHMQEAREALSRNKPVAPTRESV